MATRTAISQNRLSIRGFENSLNFSGSSQYVTLEGGSNLPIFTSSGQFSIEMWVRPPAVPAANIGLYGEGNSATNNQEFAILFNTTGKIQAFAQNDSDTTIWNDSSTTLLPIDKWTHVVLTQNAGTGALYMNAVQDATNFSYTPSGTFTFNQATLGAQRRVSPTSFYTGRITGVRMFNTALTGTQVTNLYYLNEVPSSVVAQYLFTEGSGTVLNDSIGNNEGTITSATWVDNTPSQARIVISPARTAISGARTSI